jgi:hypothetical protein
LSAITAPSRVPLGKYTVVVLGARAAGAAA